MISPHVMQDNARRHVVSGKITASWIVMFVVQFLIINFMLWIGCAHYEELRVPTFISIVGAEILGAMLFGLFLQGWKR